MDFKNQEEFFKFAEQMLPKSDEEAGKRFRKFKSLDPFQDIPSALLNSVDIFKYVATTGMIYPFDPKKLKGASYAAALLGPCVYWDDDGKMHSVEIKDKDTLILKPNSIAFVTIEPKIRIPDYLALRFNLKIDHVYKGLLLGTGPLVDPGFEGSLSIPLHNFTLNEYTLQGGKGLIWIELTKLSPYEKWDKPSSDTNKTTKGFYFEFLQDKKNQTLLQYIEKAVHDGQVSEISVRNAIPQKLKTSQNQSRQALKKSKSAIKQVNTIKRYGIIGAIISILIGIFAIIGPIYSLIQDSMGFIASSRDKLIEKIQTEQNKKLAKYEQIQNEQNRKIDEYKKIIDELKKELDKIKGTLKNR